eukprot:6335700-Amphidinium_carterae.1
MAIEGVSVNLEGFESNIGRQWHAGGRKEVKEAQEGLHPPYHHFNPDILGDIVDDTLRDIRAGTYCAKWEGC